MGIHRAPSTLVVVGFAAAVCVLALAAGPARAQQGATGPPPPGNRDPFSEVRERQQREAQLRSVEMVGGVRKTDRRGAEAAAEQMREDFKSIQILRNKIARHVLSGKPLDPRFIAAETEEVNKRAGRLKTHLARETFAAEKKEQEKQLELGDAQLKDALVTLCKRIDSFTENPVFKVRDVVDVEQSAKAGRDLVAIIQLSGGIRRAAERQSKTQRK